MKNKTKIAMFIISIIIACIGISENFSRIEKSLTGFAKVEKEMHEARYVKVKL